MENKNIKYELSLIIDDISNHYYDHDMDVDTGFGSKLYNVIKKTVDDFNDLVDEFNDPDFQMAEKEHEYTKEDKNLYFDFICDDCIYMEYFFITSIQQNSAEITIHWYFSLDDGIAFDIDVEANGCFRYDDLEDLVHKIKGELTKNITKNVKQFLYDELDRLKSDEAFNKLTKYRYIESK